MMEVNTFCSSLREEMASWKAKTQDLLSKSEGFASGPDPKWTAPLEDLKKMIDGIEQTLGRLERECPVNWDTEKGEIEQAMCELREKWNDTASYSPDDFE